MKTPDDPRHKKRQLLVQELYKIEFHNQKISDEAKEILSHRERIDPIIAKHASEFPIEKINKVDLSVLRLALFELLIKKTEPTNVIIDEAVELAKEFGGKSSSTFINGVLGGLIKNEKTS